MNSEAADMGLDASEQLEQASSLSAHPPFREPETSSSGLQVSRDMGINPIEAQHTAPVDTIDAAAVDLLKDAVEDGPGEDWSAAESKV